MPNDKNEQTDAEALKLLEVASKQYEEYLRITASAEIFAETEQESPSKQDWTHPMGLVLASSR